MKPPHPGEVLLNEFLIPNKITQVEFAAVIDVPFRRVNEIVRGKRSVTPNTAWRFQYALGADAILWMNLQMQWDLWHARQQPELKHVLSRIRPTIRL